MYCLMLCCVCHVPSLFSSYKVMIFWKKSQKSLWNYGVFKSLKSPQTKDFWPLTFLGKTWIWDGDISFFLIFTYFSLNHHKIYNFFIYHTFLLLGWVHYIENEKIVEYKYLTFLYLIVIDYFFLKTLFYITTN